MDVLSFISPLSRQGRGSVKGESIRTFGMIGFYFVQDDLNPKGERGRYD
jgi:hypothetical protein